MKKFAWVGIAAGLTAIALVIQQTDAADTSRRSAAEALEGYFAAWDEPDAEKRAAIVKGCWAEGATYTDPTAHVEGRAGLVEHIGGLMGNPQFKNFTIVRISDIDEHHDVFRFEWEMRNAEGQSVTKGMDYGEMDSDGNITKIVGFFGPFRAMK